MMRRAGVKPNCQHMPPHNSAYPTTPHQQQRLLPWVNQHCLIPCLIMATGHWDHSTGSINFQKTVSLPHVQSTPAWAPECRTPNHHTQLTPPIQPTPAEPSLPQPEEAASVLNLRSRAA